MKRIWIAGSSGSGKSTLAAALGETLGVPVYHRDYITWDADFDNERTEEEQLALTREITSGDAWIFDGARFTASKIDGRLERCDTIIHLSLNRFLCLYRAARRGRQKARQGGLREIDRQPFSFELLRYILFEYPGKRGQRDALFALAKNRGIDVVILRTQKAVDAFVAQQY